MLITILGWYSFIMIVASTMAIIATSERKASKISGGQRLLTIILQSPMIFYIGYMLFK